MKRKPKNGGQLGLKGARITRLMDRDESFWQALMSLDLSPSEALALFDREYAGGLIACHPNGPDAKPIRVSFKSGDDADHYLFKADGDTHGRSFANEQRPDDFQIERSDRIRWIGEILRAPDAIYRDSRNVGTLLYVCRALGEDFAVVIRGESNRYFVTGYIASEPKWSQKKRDSLQKVYPANSKRGAKKRAKKRDRE